MSKNTRQGNKLGRSCVIRDMSAPLSGEFGMRMLRTKFPEHADAVLHHLGTITRGPRKGQPRGVLHWEKVLEGGFHYGEGRVVYPGTRGWCVTRDGYLDQKRTTALDMNQILKEHDHA
jgi:hypothetical protein